jgi:hypothetical protein
MDELEGFLQWFLNGGATSIGAVPLLNAVHSIESVWSVTWYRQPPFQVQMFIVPPNYVIPEHTHPNVDSFEVYIGGQIRFSHSGEWVISEEDFTTPTERDLARKRGATIRVRPGDLHGGIFGPAGGVFMSVQQWLHGVDPHCVAADYSGPVMGPDHFSKVVFGEPVLKEQDKLTAKDAAHKAKEDTHGR